MLNGIIKVSIGCFLTCVAAASASAAFAASAVFSAAAWSALFFSAVALKRERVEGESGGRVEGEWTETWRESQYHTTQHHTNEITTTTTTTTRHSHSTLTQHHIQDVPPFPPSPIPAPHPTTGISPPPFFPVPPFSPHLVGRSHVGRLKRRCLRLCLFLRRLVRVNLRLGRLRRLEERWRSSIVRIVRTLQLKNHLIY
jgi:hypothetical protein